MAPQLSVPCSKDGTFPHAPIQPIATQEIPLSLCPEVPQSRDIGHKPTCHSHSAPALGCIQCHRPVRPHSAPRKTVRRSTTSQLVKSFSWCHDHLVHSQFSRSPHLLGGSSTEHRRAKVMLPSSVASPSVGCKCSNCHRKRKCCTMLWERTVGGTVRSELLSLLQQNLPLWHSGTASPCTPEAECPSQVPRAKSRI